MASKKKSKPEQKKVTLPETKVTLDTKKTVTYNKIKLRNLLSAKVKLPGSVTQEWYVWLKAGYVLEVDERDASALLEKRLGNKHCCGGSPSMLFEEVTL